MYVLSDEERFKTMHDYDALAGSGERVFVLKNDYAINGVMVEKGDKVVIEHNTRSNFRIAMYNELVKVRAEDGYEHQVFWLASPCITEFKEYFEYMDDETQKLNDVKREVENLIEQRKVEEKSFKWFKWEKKIELISFFLIVISIILIVICIPLGLCRNNTILATMILCGVLSVLSVVLDRRVHKICHNELNRINENYIEEKKKLWKDFQRRIR